MTRTIYRTPGTLVTWGNVREWCMAAFKLDRRRSSEKRNRDLKTHAGIMPLSMIYAETDLEAIECAIYLLKQGPSYLCRPERGYRADHPSTPIIVALSNRAAVLRREADVMPTGDNWNAVSNSSQDS